MNVLFVAAEVAPYATTGGLGEVVASLPGSALQSVQVNCRVLVPAYSSIDLPRQTLQQWEIPFDGSPLIITLQRAENTNLPLYFLDIPRYFKRDQIYGYVDDPLRFGAFCRGALLAQKYFQAHDWPVDVFHCHDWHAALLPVYKSTFGAAGKVLLTINNLAYQGTCDMSFLPRLGLPWSLANWRELEFWWQLNPLKGGLIFADAISAVSPTYAKEMQTADYGCGLDGVLRERSDKIFGILNGIDQHVWNPAEDAYIVRNYSPDNAANKKECKRHLQEISGFAQNEKTPLLGMVTRLTGQKGIDLLLGAIDKIMSWGAQLVVLGSGEAWLQSALKDAERRHPQQMKITTGVFDVALSHQIYAGSDFFLIPSHFEPCGLTQMISMRYGTIPIVRTTGGLADTVHDFTPPNNAGNGFVFHEAHADDLIKVVQRGIQCFNSPAWKTLQNNAFAADFSWQQSALKYKKLYALLLSSDGAPTSM